MRTAGQPARGYRQADRRTRRSRDFLRREGGAEDSEVPAGSPTRWRTGPCGAASVLDPKGEKMGHPGEENHVPESHPRAGLPRGGPGAGRRRQGGGDPCGACAGPRPSSAAGSAPEPPGRRWANAPRGGEGGGGVRDRPQRGCRNPRLGPASMRAAASAADAGAAERTPATVSSPDEGGAWARRPRAATAQALCLAWEWPRAISAGRARTLPRRVADQVRWGKT